MTAKQLMKDDARSRTQVLTAVKRAWDSIGGRIDPERCDQEGNDLAGAACAFLLEQIYKDDAEIFALRKELAHYKETALINAQMTPPFIRLPNGLSS